MNSADTSKWVALRNSELIKDKVLEIGDGYRVKNNEMDSEGLPFARAGNIKDGFQFLNADILGKKSVVKAGNKVAKINDVVLTTKGTFGRVALVRQNTEKFVYSPQLCYWRVKNYSVIHPRFLYYWIQGPEFLTQAHQVKSSTDMADYTNLKDQRAMSITAPTIDIQEKIAAILSAYDDLIENNKRRIALLEKMAEEIYREWFVRMRFPGYEKVKFYKGLPSNWIEAKVKSIVYRKPYGRIYREKELHNDGNVVVIDQSRSDQLGFYYGDPQHIATPDNPVILFGDHSCKMILMTKPFSLAENVIPFLPKNKMPTYFLYHLIKDLAKTTEYKRHWTELTNRDVLLPYEELQKRFEDIVKTNHKNIEVLNESIVHASKARDLLLGRLISGKLPVGSLNIQNPPSMQNEQDVAHAQLYRRR